MSGWLEAAGATALQVATVCFATWLLGGTVHGLVLSIAVLALFEGNRAGFAGRGALSKAEGDR